MKRTFKIIVCLVVLALPLPASAQDRLLDIQEVAAPGGITAWLVEDHTLPIIAIKFAFRGAGAVRDPAEKQGLAQLLSNTLDEGAGPHDSQQFQKLLNDNNISLGFGSGRDHFSGNLTTLTKHKDLAFDLLRLALNEPRFDKEAVDRMRAANMTRIRSNLSDPDWKASRLWLDAVFEGHPYAQNSGGTLSSLPLITSEDLHGFVKNYFSKGNLVIAVTGDITPDELKSVLDQVFGALPAAIDLPKAPDIQAQNPGEIILYQEDIPQTIIQMLQPGIGRRDPEYYTALIMNHVLGSGGFGSRLTEEIREKRGLTYGISTSFFQLEHANLFSLSTSTKNETAGEMIDLVKKEWQRMRDEPITPEELANAKSYLIGSLPLSLSSTGSIANVVLGLRLDDLPIDYLDQRAGRINAVTAEAVQALAKALLKPEDLTIIMVGSPQNVTPSQKVENLPNVE